MTELEDMPEAILFIDEIHTVIGAGAPPGCDGRLELLKPALQSGGLRCMGSTTYKEFRQHFEKDRHWRAGSRKLMSMSRACRTALKSCRG